MRFDQQLLFERLLGLGSRSAAGFALCITERLLPSLSRYTSADETIDPKIVTETLDLVWEWCAGAPVQGNDATRRIDSCKQIIHQLSQAEQIIAKYAEDAVLSLSYALRAYTIGPQEAGWAAQCGYEAVDYFVTEERGVDYAAVGELAALNHPVVQRELHRQEEDVLYLEKLTDAGEPTKASMERLRERARFQSQTVFALDD